MFPWPRQFAAFQAPEDGHAGEPGHAIGLGGPWSDEDLHPLSATEGGWVAEGGWIPRNR